MSVAAERIRQLRNALGLSQEAFGKNIGLSRSEVRNIEYGITQIRDLTIPVVCRAYAVNEAWLRTGEGDMFRKLSREEEIGEFMSKIITKEDDFSSRLISVLARLDVEEWEMLEQLARKLAESNEE